MDAGADRDSDSDPDSDSDSEVDPPSLAARLLEATRTATPADSEAFAGLSLADGYRVQEALVAARPGRVAGYKLGFTNERLQREVGVPGPVYGRVFADTVDPGTVRASDFVTPRAEPEVVVRLGESVADPSREAVAEAATGVAPAIEVVDSRTGSWELDPGTAVADNALAAGLVTGPERPVGECRPLAEVAVTITAGGAELTGRGAAVLGDPLAAVAWLVDRRPDPLPAGTLVSTGSLTNTVTVRAGEPVVAEFSPLGSVRIDPV